MTASDAIDAAVEAATAVIPVDPDDGTCIVAYQPDGIPLWGTPQSLANVIVHAAAPVLLAAERERIAKELEHRANAYNSRAADGLSSLQLCPDEAESLQDGAATLRIAAKAIRGSVAGEPPACICPDTDVTMPCGWRCPRHGRPDAHEDSCTKCARGSVAGKPDTQGGQ